MNKPLIWHDEEKISWTYCDKFEISINKCVTLYRCYWGGFGQFREKSYSLIGGFSSLEIAKKVAQYIINAERDFKTHTDDTSPKCKSCSFYKTGRDVDGTDFEWCKKVGFYHAMPEKPCEKYEPSKKTCKKCGNSMVDCPCIYL